MVSHIGVPEPLYDNPFYCYPIIVHNKKIPCFKFETGELTVGDYVAMLTGENKERIRFGKVESIQIENVDHTKVIGARGRQIGMKLEFYGKKTNRYFQLPVRVAKLLENHDKRA